MSQILRNSRRLTEAFGHIYEQYKTQAQQSADSREEEAEHRRRNG